MKFSERSQARLNTCHLDLIRLFEAVIGDGHDCTIIEGHRGKEAQDEAFRTGRSKKKWPEGKHNTLPSQAVDVMPFPIDWVNRAQHVAFAKAVFDKAEELDIKVRWGGDFNMDGNWTNDSFIDRPHWELLERKA